MSKAVSPVRVRTANWSDLNTVVQFNALLAWETEDRALDPATVRAGVAAVLLDHELGFYLIAEVDGGVVGQLLITSEWSDWRNSFFWWIQSVYVAPDYRRQGVYRALDAHVRAEALRRGNVVGVRLYVERNNHIAQKAYRSLGMACSIYDMYEFEFGG
jgi:GNAT superfamily N-acetyltransferase